MHNAFGLQEGSGVHTSEQSKQLSTASYIGGEDLLTGPITQRWGIRTAYQPHRDRR